MCVCFFSRQDYVQDMSVPEVRDYLRALLTAVDRVHRFHIIHRDIKHSNFLYNRKDRQLVNLPISHGLYYLQAFYGKIF